MWGATMLCLLVAPLVLSFLPGVRRSEAGNLSLASEVEMEIVGQVGGAARAVAVKGEYAYVGLGPPLAVLEVSNHARPLLLGQTALFSDVVQGVVASPSSPHVYVAAGSDGLDVIDVGVPAEPVEVAACHTARWAFGLALDGSHVCV